MATTQAQDGWFGVVVGKGSRESEAYLYKKNHKRTKISFGVNCAPSNLGI
jgi:hypothetical protein